MNLAFAVEIGCIDVERFAEFCLAGLEAGEKVQARESAAHGSRSDGIAGGFEFSHISVIEEVEALSHQLQLPHLAEIESLAEAQVGFPGCRIAI